MKLDPSMRQAIVDFGREMTEKYPKAFPSGNSAWKRIVPLKVGIFDDLVAAHPDVPSEIIKTFIGRHTRTGIYLKAASVTGKPRVDLEGNVTGSVSSDEAAHAKAMCLSRHLRRTIDRQKNRVINDDISIDDCARKITKKFRGVSFDSVKARLLNAIAESSSVRNND